MLRTLELHLVLALAGSASFVALWLTLRRAAAFDWMMFWICRGVGIAVSTVVFTTMGSVELLAACVGLVLAASQVLLLRAVWRHARPGPEWLKWRRVVWALLGLYLVAPWLAPHGRFDPAGTGGPISILFRLAPVPTSLLVFAVLLAGRHAMDRLGARLMIFGVALQLVQNAGGTISNLRQLFGRTLVATPELFVWLQVLTFVSLTLGSLYLVLAESRDEMQRIATEREQARHLETLGRMASGVAHDFNNVLTGIRLSAELARLKLPATETAAELDTIRLAVDRGGEQVRSLLLFARGETPEADQAFDLHALVRELEPMLGKLAGPSHRLRVALADCPAEILGNRSNVTRILSNLVINARDAMADGGEVAVSTAILPSAGEPSRKASVRWLALRVTDTGVGISPEVLPRIFEPFYTTKGEGRGTGLGLTIVQTFVQKMGGTITVASKLGRGTTFELRLPLAELGGSRARALVHPVEKPAPGLDVAVNDGVC